MRRRPTAEPPELRRRLIERYREEASSGPERTPAVDGGFYLSPWRRLAERLEAGEVVEVSGWEIVDLRPGVDPQIRYRIEADGTATPLPWPNSPLRWAD